MFDGLPLDAAGVNTLLRGMRRMTALLTILAGVTKPGPHHIILTGIIKSATGYVWGCTL